MDISYKIAKKVISFTQKKEDDLFSYVLTNQIGDSIIQSLKPSVCKSFGIFKRDSSKNIPIKIIDWFGNTKANTKKVEVGEYTFKKEFSSPYYEDSDATSEAGYEKITISPNGGFIFETTAKEEIIIDLDVRYFDDFSKFGKNYSIYTQDNVLFIEFTKVNDFNEESLKIFIGIKTPNILYSTVEQWIEKSYWYDEQRGLDPKEFIFRALSIKNNQEYKKIHVGFGFTKLEVKEQLLIMDNFENIIDLVEKGVDEEGFGNSISKTPISMQSQLAYDVAKRKIFDFVIPNRKNEENTNSLLAGHPWFYQEWTRDEVFSLRAFLEIGEVSIVKEKLISLCSLVDDNGELPRMFIDNSLKSIDASILLTKRIEDFIFFEEKKGRFVELYEDNTIHFFHKTILKIFNGIMKSNWDAEKELVKVKQGDWWRDTIEWAKYPLGVQVGMLNVISTASILSRLIGENSKCGEFLDFEAHYKKHIIKTYHKNSILYDEPENEVVTCDIFLAYYLYPDLCTLDEWELIFEKALKHLYLHWGGVSSLSKFDSRFRENYSGVDDISYHQGDSWYFINSITAISLNHCNSSKFRKEIGTIINALNEQLLFKGAFGHIAEISSAKHAQTKGCIAQAWSLALYIELMHNVYGIENRN